MNAADPWGCAAAKRLLRAPVVKKANPPRAKHSPPAPPPPPAHTSVKDKTVSEASRAAVKSKAAAPQKAAAPVKTSAAATKKSANAVAAKAKEYYEAVGCEFETIDWEAVAVSGGTLMLIAAVSPETLIHSLRGYALEEWQTLHYGRNDNNFMPGSEENAIAAGWVKLPPNEALYHQNTATDPENPNGKYISPDGHQEAVYTYKGELIEDVRDVGTYNFSPANGEGFETADKVFGGIGHFFADMLPYYLWGNSPDDPTPWHNRVFG